MPKFLPPKSPPANQNSQYPLQKIQANNTTLPAKQINHSQQPHPSLPEPEFETNIKHTVTILK
jgi:hypothetical protein